MHSLLHAQYAWFEVGLKLLTPLISHAVGLLTYWLELVGR